MKVLNVAGFDLKFERNEKVIRIPNDGALHSIPDDYFYQGDCFDGMLRIIVPPIPVQQVIRKMENINKSVDINDPSIKEIIIGKVEEKKNKPLKGKRLKPHIRAEFKKNKTINKNKED